jgi:sulfite exporter TauE/SafE
MEIWTGFIIGLVGSVHCIGMCGPIVLALPSTSNSHWVVLFTRIMYNFGRVITYAFLGAVFGLFGSRLVLIGLQQNVSIIIGVIILITVLTPSRYKNYLIQTRIYQTFNSQIKSMFAKLMSRKANSSFLLFGIVNGFLPCGFVYVAIGGAVATEGVLSGTLFMALFGLGTMPIMLAASILGKHVNTSLRNKINKIMPVLAIILAIIFILRGLNLGIPYLSPKLSSMQTNTEVICH